MDLLNNRDFDFEGIRAAINEKTKLVTIQRSKGYETRPTLSVDRIRELIAFVKSVKPDVICMVDNCYGEFVEEREPLEVGADMIVGSLIKNLGGSSFIVKFFCINVPVLLSLCSRRYHSILFFCCIPKK